VEKLEYTEKHVISLTGLNKPCVGDGNKDLVTAFLRGKDYARLYHHMVDLKKQIRKKDNPEGSGYSRPVEQLASASRDLLSFISPSFTRLGNEGMAEMAVEKPTDPPVPRPCLRFKAQ
jgi:hypothetical protein